MVDNIQDRRGAAKVTVGKRKRKREYVSIVVYYPPNKCNVRTNLEGAVLRQHPPMKGEGFTYEPTFLRRTAIVGVGVNIEVIVS